jgi:RNA polymerase sigma factor (sigma-70 family)
MDHPPDREMKKRKRNKCGSQVLPGQIASSSPCLPHLGARLDLGSSLPYVQRALWRFGIDGRDIEDLAHEVLMVVHRRLATYDPRFPLNAWLGGIAWRVARRHQQRVYQRREVLAHEPCDDTGPEAPGLDVEQLAAQSETSRLIRRLLERIRGDRRVVIVLHDLDGLPMRAVATALGIPKNTAWNRLWLGRKDLATALKRPRRRAGGRGDAGGEAPRGRRGLVPDRDRARCRRVISTPVAGCFFLGPHDS